MKGKLVGYYRSEGSFIPDDKDKKDNPVPIPFDNVVFQFLSDLENQKRDNMQVTGKRVRFTECKVKLKYLNDIIFFDLARLSDLDDYLGKVFDWSFNQYGNVERIELVSES